MRVLLAVIAFTAMVSVWGGGSVVAQGPVDGVALVRGPNLVTYDGPESDVAGGVRSLDGVLTALWAFDNAEKTWAVWAPALPEALRGVERLIPGRSYFVVVSEDAFWAFAGPRDARVLEFHFERGNEGWEAGFADLPVDPDPLLYELAADHRALPPGLIGNGLFIQGHNRSDDLLMFFTRPVHGFAPGGDYTVAFNIDLVTSVEGGGVGIGGAPGESVFVKAGAAGVEPMPAAVVDNFLRLNVDLGNQSSEGTSGIVLGNVALPDGAPRTAAGWGVKTLGLDGRAVAVSADASGTIWLIVGTDSGFEGLTTLYYARIGVDIRPAD